MVAVSVYARLGVTIQGHDILCHIITRCAHCQSVISPPALSNPKKKWHCRVCEHMYDWPD